MTIIKAYLVYEKERSIIKNKLTEELLVANSYIDKVECYSAITAPESSLGTILSKQKDSDIQLKRAYVKKRKLLNFLDRLNSDIKSFLCSNCGEIIDIERLLLMPKASLCETCASA
ncbi:TraR/DksA C4-type zinc finger protein [Sulfurimonas sp. MAG313]|nr:TraR/DksA C4-type zinc finger protein [Sulfurimonas sp. MAG313]MDF1881504.1 TraR/DksA C4-type zinc finger protein [Sulfurimonas sp. MAG313]